ncbi:EAL domain-containing protein [Pseudovibrio flavus]|uniref:EAL domain-containing protein n=1 Tax=Pseudovibrio flavus TaxID=2529854 RepID=UPI00211CED0D|nr:EAL domain-containing protein [Pseudovibrio flavus]
MPLMVFRAVLILAITILNQIGYIKVGSILFGINDRFLNLMPFIFCAVLTCVNAAYRRISVPISMICSILSISTLSFLYGYGNFESNFNILTAITVSYLCSFIIEFTSHVKILCLYNDFISDRAFKTLIQLTIVFIASIFLYHVMVQIDLALGDITTRWGVNLIPDSYASGLFYEFTRQLCWFFGVHSHNVLGEILNQFETVSNFRMNTLRHGIQYYSFLTYDFMDIYAAIGGCGSTLSLIIAVLLSSHRKAFHGVAKASLPFSVFNINEPIVYGMPIVFNPLLFIPFLFVPLINFTIAYWLTYVGFIPPIVNDINWMTPPLYNVWLGTGGSMLACVVQLALIVLGVFVYRPFISKSHTELMSHAIFVRGTETGNALRISEHRDLISDHNAARFAVNNILQAGDFTIYVQPQFDARSQTFNGAEVLVRYIDAKGNVTPPYFFDLFEKTETLPDIDYMVIDRLSHAVDDFKLPNGFKVAINVSPISFKHAGILKELVRLAQKMQTKGLELTVEITENQMWSTEESYIAIFKELQKAGITLALDDFGTGYSNLTTFLKFQYDYVKIDMTVVSLDTIRKHPKIITAFALIGESGGAQIIAEGVEHPDQVEALKQSNIHIYQGYYFGRPMPFAQMVSMVEEGDAKAVLPIMDPLH